MVALSGGPFLMGSDRFYPEERPRRPAEVGAFRIDRTPVTNARFASFVQATGYVTLAERPQPHPEHVVRMVPPCSAVFVAPAPNTPLRGPTDWWRLVPAACWRRPAGPGSSVEGLDDHPAVHVAFEDALAFAEWAGKSLPTEAEWEYAARGGLEGEEYAWGSSLTPEGRHLANTWQGQFPFVNLMEDGFAGTSPVGSFRANGYGLFDMIGNVWEWTTDDYAAPGQPQPSSCCRRQDGGTTKVIKGGSYLCAPNYCRRYRPAARHPQRIDTTTSHLGFRCVRRLG
ncbi:formylglycine-generating enzyme family protein [Paracoccus aeridis]|uniref:formylglycine-generating enzyme family protein n=1 Tax=Paracoccus aeridis TaxID=1966466 RepID=UPI00191C387C|nr:formylglycine-generating enzyme family protein [Paracoccus aeridis]